MTTYAKDQPKAEYAPVQCVGLLCDKPSFFPEDKITTLAELFADLITKEWDDPKANRGVHASVLGEEQVVGVWWDVGWVEFGYEAAMAVLAKSNVEIDLNPRPNRNVSKS